MHQHSVSPNCTKVGEKRTPGINLSCHRVSIVWMQLVPWNIQEYWHSSLDIHSHSCLPSVISVQFIITFDGEDTAKDLLLGAACLLLLLPGSTVTHPRLCRAHSRPGSVMSLGFSVGSTVCPVLTRENGEVCVWGGDIAFYASEKDVKNKNKKTNIKDKR